MLLDSFPLAALAPEIDDPEQGFVDCEASTIELTVGNRNLLIRQSPTLLSSNRKGGTTGAGTLPDHYRVAFSLDVKLKVVLLVVWKITPLFATWIASPSNLLFRNAILNSHSSVLELGCGISGIIAVTLGPLVGYYVLTDQVYVMRILNQNLDANRKNLSQGTNSDRKNAKSRGGASKVHFSNCDNIHVALLDWETDQVTPELARPKAKANEKERRTENIGFDILVACDCIYNDALIEPLVQTCVDACKLGSSITVCIVAQQLRSPDIFEAWLRAFQKKFRVWRVPDSDLIEELRSDSGFVIHIGILKEGESIWS